MGQPLRSRKYVVVVAFVMSNFFSFFADVLSVRRRRMNPRAESENQTGGLNQPSLAVVASGSPRKRDKNAVLKLTGDDPDQAI